MIDFPHIGDLCRPASSKIVFLVCDGLGGMRHPERGLSELEAARLPHLDELARRSACGLTVPVTPGVTPGSGPGHLALFGYDPVKYLMGRGVLEALGIGLELRPDEVAARGNFCTVDDEGRLVDRRAGRIPTSESAPLARLLDALEVPGAQVSVHPVRDYRFVLVLRGPGLGDRVTGTDPQAVGVPPLEAEALDTGSEATARAANAFIEGARRALAGRDRANMVLLRGFSKLPDLPSFGGTYRLRAAAVAAYPMYRGLARVVGMEVLETGSTFEEELDTLANAYDAYDFFFLHYKPADSAGEDGDFEAKVARLEELDAHIPRVLALEPDVLVVAGDHATPSALASHSWHPVPLLVHSKATAAQGVERFTERACAHGELGTVPAVNVMLLALAHAGRLARFGP